MSATVRCNTCPIRDFCPISNSYQGLKIAACPLLKLLAPEKKETRP
jgi:hypothetical protein